MSLYVAHITCIMVLVLITYKRCPRNEILKLHDHDNGIQYSIFSYGMVHCTVFSLDRTHFSKQTRIPVRVEVEIVDQLPLCV